MRRLLLIVTLALCDGLCLRAEQAQVPAAPSREKIIASATDLMRQARYCAIITVGEESQPQARTVDPLWMAEGTLEVWIITNSDSRKVAQLRQNPRTTLYYFLSSSPGYVTLLGKADILSTPAAKEAAWTPSWGEERRKMLAMDKFVLLHFRPRRIEMVSYAHGLPNDPKTMRPVMLDLP